MSHCLIGLGSNQGNRRSLLRQAVAALQQHPRIQDLVCSRFYPTQPIGGPVGQQEFLNAAVRCSTSLEPQEILTLLKQLERQLGRTPSERWGARPIDLDLLLLDDLIWNSPELRVPHPRMAFRRFVLQPAADVAGPMVHPEIGWTVGRLLAHLETSLPYTAVGGKPRTQRAQLVAEVGASVGGRWLHDTADDEQLISVCRQATGPGNEAALEFVTRRAALLDVDRWTDRQTPAVSDFSYDQMLAIARCHLPAASSEVWQRCWTQARDRVVQPVLLVLWQGPPDSPELDSPEPGSPEPGSPTPDSRQPDEPLQVETDRVVSQWREGPVLRLGQASLSDAVFELTAAVQSMC